MALAYSPNGRILAAGGGNDPVRLWDTDTGKEIRTLGETWVNAVAFSPRGSVLVTAGAFKTIRLWEVATGKEYNKLEGHSAAIKALAVSPDGSMLASGAQDGTIILWELLTGKPITQFKGHTDEINGLAFSADNNLLASASSDRSVQLWDCETAKPVRVIDGGCALATVVFGADGKSVISAGDDQVLRVWNLDDAKLVRTLKGHTGSVVSLLLSHGKLLSGGHDESIRVWGEGESTLTVARDLGDSDALAITKDGKFLACAGVNNSIRIFETATGKEVSPGAGPRAAVTGVSLSGDGRWLASGSALGMIYLWDARTGKEVRHWSCPGGGDVLLTFAPDARSLASVSSNNDAVRIWDPNVGKEIMNLPADPGDPVLCLAYAPDGIKLAIGRHSGKAELWDLKEKSIVQELKLGAPVYALAFEQEGKLVALAGGNKIGLFEVDTGREVRAFNSKSEGTPASMPAIASLAFSSDGKTLAAGCYDAVIRLYDITTGKEKKAMEGHGNVAYALAFSGDGRTLASASFDKTVRLWEAYSGLQIAVYKGHIGPVTSLAYYKDGRGIFSGSADTTVLQWDTTWLQGKEGKLPRVNLGPDELKTAWLDLASEDAGRGFQALWKLIAAKEAAMPFLSGQVNLIDPDHVDKMFVDLNSEEYKIRMEATKELERYGIWMKGRLLTMRKNPPTLEVQRRIDQMLTKLDVPGTLSLEQERLRARRTMLALEQINSAEAMALLDKLVAGAPETDLQEEAKASLARMRK
jgi:WD40 repeat protein